MLPSDGEENLECSAFIWMEWGINIFVRTPQRKKKRLDTSVRSQESVGQAAADDRPAKRQ